MDFTRVTRTSATAADLQELVYELLDAHDDTVRLAQDRRGEFCWATHLDYLMRLQRVGREALARLEQAGEPGAEAEPAAGR